MRYSLLPMSTLRPSNPTKAVIVHSLDQARLAVSVAAELSRPLTLASAPGAAAYAGAPWFLEVVAQAAARHPEIPVTALLDCADHAGLAMGALRQGLDQVCFTGRKATAEKLAAIAQSQGCLLLRKPPKALDLNTAAAPRTACRQWLESA